MSSIVNNTTQFVQYNFRYFKSKQSLLQEYDDALSEINRIWRPAINKSYTDVDLLRTSQRYEMPNGTTTYQDPQKLTDSLEKFDNLTTNIEMGGSFKKSRLLITADPRGIFSFGLASKGLIRPQEYWSEELSKEYPNEFEGLTSGIVPFRYIEERDDKNSTGSKEFWYKSKAGKYYQCLKQQEGTEDVRIGNKKNKVFRTTTKKSYVMFERKGGKAKMVELYLPIHQTVTFDQFLPLLLVANYLKISGINTRISVIRIFDAGASGRNATCILRTNVFGWTYPIKDYGDSFDFNDLALNAVDTRWWFNIYRYVKTISDLEIIKGNNNIREADLLNSAGGFPDTPQEITNFFMRYRNWYMEEIERGNVEPLRTDKKLMIIGGVNPNGTDEEVMKEFYRIVDTIDIQFNTIEGSCKRIYKRLVEDKLNNNTNKLALTNNFKDYMTTLLTATYSYPTLGQYSEPKESAEKMDEEFFDKIEKLDQYLKNV